jgi:hypothetical protein
MEENYYHAQAEYRQNQGIVTIANDDIIWKADTPNPKVPDFIIPKSSVVEIK